MKNSRFAESRQGDIFAPTILKEALINSADGTGFQKRATQEANSSDIEISGEFATP